jgi:hypothetical protein
MASTTLHVRLQLSPVGRALIGWAAPRVCAGLERRRLWARAAGAAILWVCAHHPAALVRATVS